MAFDIAGLVAIAALWHGVRLPILWRTVQGICEYADCIRGPCGEDLPRRQKTRRARCRMVKNLKRIEKAWFPVS
jgi:hypothetical protein